MREWKMYLYPVIILELFLNLYILKINNTYSYIILIYYIYVYGWTI